jgi:hypothetical protein
MATVSSLTTAQQKLLSDFDSQLRTAILALSRAVNAANAAAEQYNVGVLSIISGLDNTELLPTTTGLSGAAPLGQGDPGYLVSYLSAFTTWFAANIDDSGHQALYVKACGSINLASLP